MNKYQLQLMAILMCSFMGIQTALAATTCVTTANELASALLTADSNNEDDVIKVAEGNYVRTIGGFVYFGNGETNSLEISGGWSEFFGNPCGQQFDNAAYSTTLDSDSMGRTLFIHTAGHVKISNLNIINGFETGPGNNGGGLRVIIEDSANRGGIIGGPNVVTIEKNSFINNNGFGAGAALINGVGRAYFRNNLVIANSSESGSLVVNLSATENYMINNTIFGNSGGLYTHAGHDDKSYVVNNLLWGNTEEDLRITRGSTGEVYLFNNNFEVETGHGATTSSGNMSVAPVFEGGLLNFTPAWGSVMVNNGKSSPTIVPIPITFPFNWNAGTLDFEGNDRVRNGQIDIGALEAPTPPDLIFKDEFEG